MSDKVAANDVKTQFDRGLALMRERRPAEAEAVFAKILEDHPNLVSVMVNRALTKLMMGRADEAREVLERAVAVDPNNALALHQLAAILFEGGDRAGALPLLWRAIRLDPRNAALQSNLGIALHDEGLLNEARACFEESLALEPGNTHALAFLSNLYLDSDAHDEFRRLADFDRFLCERHPKAPPAWKTERDFLEALRVAVESDPTLVYEPALRTAKNGAATGHLKGAPGSAIEELRKMFEVEAFAFADRVANMPDHPLVANRPSRYHIRMWGNVLSSSGYQASHNHPSGWLSGVFYVTLPDAVGAPGKGQDGWIEFGRPRAEYYRSNRIDLRLLKPKPGMMLLFPSYMWHRTLPFEDKEPRVSIAMDIVPA